MDKKYLMTPGPTQVPYQVLETQARPMIHHRTPDFENTMAACTAGLKKVFRTEGDVLIFAASGTGSLEASIANCFCPGDKIIITHNGKFGYRMVEIAHAYGLQVIDLGFPWTQIVDAQAVRQALIENPDARGVVVTQSETSAGCVNPVEEVGKIVADYPDCIYIVDSITGIGAVDCRTDEWGLDIVLTGSQKGLMLPPGLAFASVSEKAWKAVERGTLPVYYFDFKKAKKSSDKNTTPFTPALSLMNALEVSLNMILEEGLDEVLARHALNAQATRNGLEAIGMKLFAPDNGRGAATTPAWVPEGIDGVKLVNVMKNKYGVTIAGGQDDYKGKIIRVGHLGYVGRFDIITMMSALEMALVDMGYAFEFGAGVKAVMDTYLKENN